MYKNKVLLITGGTGSFGNTVLSRFLKTDLSEIRIFSRDELKQEDMRIRFNNEKLKFYIGDVREFESISSAMIGVEHKVKMSSVGNWVIVFIVVVVWFIWSMNKG